MIKMALHKNVLILTIHNISVYFVKHCTIPNKIEQNKTKMTALLSNVHQQFLAQKLRHKPVSVKVAENLFLPGRFKPV